MEPEFFEHLLEQHGVKPTANRIVVARTLAQASMPMSLSELENNILSIDKSGVFRTLRLFSEHHLVHTIDDGSGGTRYELCHSHGHDGEDDDLHPHFYCERCRRTFCLHHTALPQVELPEGFTPLSVNFVLKGICPQCRVESQSIQG
ncbi:MAG: transcriptional repressor [Prevotella sp.]|nr:transcriptional repressor [Prevotella sp.]